MRWEVTKVVKGFRMILELKLYKPKRDTTEKEKLNDFQQENSDPDTYFSLSDLRNAGKVKGSIRKAVSLVNMF